jgi:hypothetical protein
MSTRDQLNSYIAQLEQRLRLGAVIRGAAILTSVALVVTVILVVITNAFAFTSGSITVGRATLFFSLALAAVLGLALPIYALNRRRAAKMAEATFPQFQQRLVTFAERDGEKRDPFLGLLAADTLEVARHAEPKRLIPDSQLASFLGAGAVSLAILVWMILAGPGYWGRGAAMLWAATPSDAGSALYDLRVSPGDAAVRRNADQVVTATVIGLPSDAVRLYARYKSASKWDQVVMRPQEGGSGYQFVFAGLPEDVEYYVEAGPLHSRHFNLRVLDLPGVKNIRVTYRYPDWTKLQNVVEERGGDLRAVEGTQADLEVQTDRPLKDGLLVLDDDTQVKLTGGQGNIYKGTIQIAKDGEYHMAAMDQGQPVRLSNDYFIEADKASPPNIEIAQPSRDYRASPIEEVKVTVKSDDQFGVYGMALHYSVNGGPDKTVDLLKQPGAKQADGSTVLSLEDFKMVPGDVISLYATAKDARAEARTDIFFVQADPFEREFSQSQQGGGGGAGGGGGGQGDQTDISQREKEIIGETWKEHGDTTATKQEAAEAAKFLSGVQAKLGEQSRSLAGRMQSRELSEENDEFNSFVKDMNAAADAMGPASAKLQAQKWQDALSDEQKALQNLLRAEATFRQIQVAFGNRGGGGGGGGAGRDLASLFDLELDTEKNQYETGQTASSQSQKDKDIDEALQKLDELARRQEELAQQTTNGQTSEQRWQQEMLRREAEELQKQMEQMQRNGQQSDSASSSSSSGQQGSSGQAGSSGKSGSSSDPRVQQALDRLKQATDDMRKANTPQSEAEARRAADRLKEASGLLGGMRNQQTSGKLNQIGDEADRLAAQQKQQEERARQAFGSEGQRPDRDQLSAMADERQKLAEDLGQLEKDMQDTVKDLAGNNQRAASTKLRDALGDMQQSDLRSRIQRGADWTRRGVNPNYNGAEPDVTAGMERLSKEVHDAEQAMTNDQQQPGNGQQGLETALDRMERLRSQMDSLTRGPAPAQGRQPGQPGQGQPGQAQPGQGQGQQQAQAGQQGGGGSNNAAGGRQGGGNGYGGFDDGGYAGGYRGGNGGRYYGGFDTGNNTPAGGPAVRPDTSPIPPQQAYQQSMRDLNDLRPAVRNDPQMEAELQDLIRQMQKLDPSRFPGNPALVEQLHTQVLASVDKLELELQRQLDDKQGGQVRSGDTRPVPPGYEESVADYYRRLSKNNK